MPVPPQLQPHTAVVPELIVCDVGEIAIELTAADAGVPIITRAARAAPTTTDLFLRTRFPLLSHMHRCMWLAS